MDAPLAEFLEAGRDQGPSHALAPPFPGDGKVMQVAPPAVVAAQDCRNHTACGNGDLAQTGVPFEESPNRLPAVGFVEADALRFLPDSVDLIIVRSAERTKAD